MDESMRSNEHATQFPLHLTVPVIRNNVLD
jgi:hypothetical protein